MACLLLNVHVDVAGHWTGLAERLLQGMTEGREEEGYVPSVTGKHYRLAGARVRSCYSLYFSRLSFFLSFWLISRYQSISRARTIPYLLLYIPLRYISRIYQSNGACASRIAGWTLLSAFEWFLFRRSHLFTSTQTANEESRYRASWKADALEWFALYNWLSDGIGALARTREGSDMLRGDTIRVRVHTPAQL